MSESSLNLERDVGPDFAKVSAGPLQELSRHKKAVAILASLTLGLFIYSQSLQFNFHRNFLGSLDNDPTHLVHTPGCILRDMDPWEDVVDKYFKPSKSKIPSCSPNTLVKLVNGNRLVIQEHLLKSVWKYKGVSCCWKQITRKTQRTDNYDDNADYGVEISPNCTNIPHGSEGGLPTPGTQYLKVECVNPVHVQVWQDFFPLTPSPKVLSPATINKAAFWEEEKSKNGTLPPNVMVIGIDSISRLHMKRSLPRTREFLHSKGFVEMQGYTKIGDNTFPNIMAAFAGMTENETVSRCWPNRATKMDSCPFIWKNFSALNYVTAHVEDSPGLAIFNFEKTGFVIPPADYYLRPLMVAEHQAAKNRNRFGGSCTCLGGGATPTHVLMRYIRNFVQEVGGLCPFFLLSWFTSVAHDDFNGLKAYDKDFQSFLDNLIRSVGDNTVLLFISDHGYRFGGFRETFLGFYEESLPFFFIRVPPTLAKTNPDWIPTLWTNSARLTSPHDLYSTLVQLLDVVTPKSNASLPHQPSSLQLHAPSLFQVGPLKRNCEDSSIPQKYCMCGVSPDLTTSSELASELGQFIVTAVNNELIAANLSNSSCSVLSYSGFLYGREVGTGEVWNGHGKLESYKDVLLGVASSPWEGRFEARVRLFLNTKASRTTGSVQKKVLLGSVGRINSYAGKSDCISDYKMKNYCVCSSLWEEEKKRRDAKRKKKGTKGTMKHHRRKRLHGKS